MVLMGQPPCGGMLFSIGGLYMKYLKFWTTKDILAVLSNVSLNYYDVFYRISQLSGYDNDVPIKDLLHFESDGRWSAFAGGLHNEVYAPMSVLKFREKVKFFGLDGYPIVSTDFVGDVIIDRSKYRVYLVKATCLPYTYLTEYNGVRIGIKHTWDKDPKKIEIFFRKYTKLYGMSRHDVYHAQFDIDGQYINDKVNPCLFTQGAINEFSRFIKENRELFLKPQPSIMEGMR